MAVNYVRAADSLSISASSTAYTQAVSMQGANAVVATFVVFTLGGSSGLTPSLQGSNDMANWSSISTYSQITSAGYSAASNSTSIAFQYVRLALTAASGGTVIVTADVSTADL